MWGVWQEEKGLQKDTQIPGLTRNSRGFHPVRAEFENQLGFLLGSLVSRCVNRSGAPESNLGERYRDL